MAVLTIPKKIFEKDIGKANDEMDHKLAMFGTPLDTFDDENVNIEVFPNRPDLLSIQGFVREFSAFCGKRAGLKTYKIEKSGYKLVIEKSVPDEYHYAFACIVKGIKFNDARIKEIIQVQEKLGATMMRNRKKGGIGLYPLNKISFPVRFIGMDPDQIKFRPLEYPTVITGRQILSKHPTGREYGHLCENWDKFPIFIDSNGSIMSMPPIINSHDMGKIDETTRDVFIEVTGTDSNILQKALTIIVTSLAEMGGQIYSIECTQRNGKKLNIPDMTPQKTKLNYNNINKLLGLEIKKTEIKKFLEKMGHEYKKGYVYSPAWRVDILHEVDLIEDIAIAYGYDKIIPQIPQISTIGQIDSKEIIKKKISDILAGLGLIEISNLHLTTKDAIKKSNLNEEQQIEIPNSKTEFNILRPDLTNCALRILSENVDVEYPQEIFEIGKVFDNSYHENEHLSIALAPGNFTKAKQILNYLAIMLNHSIKIEKPQSNTSKTNNYCIEGRVADILINNKKVGFIGEVHPQILKNFKIKMPLTIVEFDLSEILK
ncbi:MAG: phenylalanine--tRNA ligase subunit beta [Candidatus Pacearchaeota archaeon]|jgi:phenylalanyl-tRNA synthetase beta chain